MLSVPKLYSEDLGMVDYNAIKEILAEKNLHFFIFYTKADKLVKAVIRHFPAIFLQRTSLWPSRR
jgi:hypothetical protein